MNEVSVKMKNCFGIKNIENVFNFEKANSVLVYAPNGVMKTSFTKTFKRISENNQPEEAIFRKPSSYSIKIDGVDIQPEQILVVEPFNQSVSEKNISTLLVNSALKEEYDILLKVILDSKKKLAAALAKLSGLKKDDIEKQIMQDFNSTDIFRAIEQIQAYDYDDETYSKIEYSAIFDSKVVDLLKESSVSEEIQRYIDTYNKLISESKVFVKDVFSPIKAISISNALSKENYFKAKHKILLNGVDGQIESESDLNSILVEQNRIIHNDPTLKAISDKISNGVNSIKAFQEILSRIPELAADLGDLQILRKKIWKAYYKTQNTMFDLLLAQFNAAKLDLERIERQASLEETIWYHAVKEFKERFHVPFNLSVENKTNAILGTNAPNIQFKFSDGDLPLKVFNRGQLTSLDTLSVGERRALYLLYVIFEFKARIAKNQKTVIIIDDIADSFDYKNKYAIIEYLREMSEQPLFRIFILTHNFDFYRTFQGRVIYNAKWTNSFIAESDEGDITLIQGGHKSISDPFSLWKSKCHSNPLMYLSMIPFVRNLIEFRNGTSDPDYGVLTSMLHMKSTTDSITARDLWEIIHKNIVATAVPTFDIDIPIKQMIFSCASEICTTQTSGEICLERKICLSIAIRIQAEIFLFDKLIDKCESGSNQTTDLYNRYIKENELNPVLIEKHKVTLGQVILMTPENIHLNSFMYEPLVDLSDKHLIKLYNDVLSLI